ncbi:filamentous hemagglutinin N-terminal domain-containing protein, partial [Pseudomonas sp. UBA1879]|uniref:two-partner secretion domain-containing protein n=1 Tax=Pseudomonas sp. UBA1879 TaxID=1947305 RepID=UPI0025E97C4B
MDVRHFNFLTRQPSAKLLERSRFCGMPKRGLAFILANAMFWQPLLAQADGIAVNGTTQTTMGQAGNGVPIVNIAAPNASGLSHNQFQQFNVGSQGVILNNATDRTQNTQLGGIIVGNPNLNGRAAGIILNEVVGANASQLNGYTEVAGQSARVIVANPYGISCNGCGFINTPRVTLTTGRPVLDNGRLDRFRVEGGSVSIDGVGLNADNVDQFDIITRSTKINAELHAKNLDIVTGRNDVDAQSLTPTVLANDGSAKPQLAIDSSALGGMYAGAIRLVGTEAGVGVKLAGNMAASGGDIQIDVNGHLAMAQAASGNAINVKAASADLRGKVYGTSVNVQARDALNVQQNIAARDRINLSSDGQLTNSAVVEAGVNADNSRNATGDTAINAQSVRNSGSVIASRALQVSASQALNNQGGTLSGQASTQVTTVSLDNRQVGRILGQGNVSVSSGQILNAQGGLIASAGSLSIDAGLFDNSQRGKVSSAAALSAVITKQLLNGMGLFSASGNLSINAANLENRNGEISSLSDMALSGRQADNGNAGRLLANGGLSVTYDGLSNWNGGIISGQRNVSLNLGQLSNDAQGSVYAKGNLDIATMGLLDNRQGALRSDAALTLRSASVANDGGSLTSAGPLTLTASGALLNKGGALLSDSGLAVTSASLDNSQNGRIAGAGVTVDTGAFNNQRASLTSTAALKLTAQQVNNSDAGRIASAMALTASVAGLDQHNGGRFYGNTDVSLDLNGGQLNNDGGLITSPGQLLLKNLSTLNNRGGEISSAHAFAVTANAVQNDEGSLISDGSLTVRVDRQFSNVRGSVSATGLDLRADTLNNDNGSLNSDTDLQVTAGSVVSNQVGELSAAGNTSLTTGRLNNKDGQITADQFLTLVVAEAVDNRGGTLGAAKGLGILAGSLDNRQSGILVSDGDVRIALGGALDNRGGRVTAQDTLTLRSDSVDNRAGVVRATEDMQLFIGALDNSQQGWVVGASGVTFFGQHLNNQNGLFSAVGPLQLQGDSVQNSAGRIASQGDVSADVDHFNQRDGELVAQGTLTLTGNTLANKAGGLIGATKALSIKAVDIDNRGGEMSSQTDVTINTRQLDNSDAGKVIAGKALQVTADLLLNRTKGMLFGDTLRLNGNGLDNTAGTLASRNNLSIDLSGDLINSMGLLSSESHLNLNAASLENTSGAVSSAGSLNISSASKVANQQGSISTDDELKLTSASLDNSNRGNVSGKGVTVLKTGAVDNSHQGQLKSADRLTLTAKQVTNRDGGLIAAVKDLTVSATSLDQQGGELFSKGSLSLDLNNGQLNNQNGLINAPGTLLLKNLKVVNNQSGEISSGLGFEFSADTLDNANGKLLSDQALIVRVAQALANVKGAISAATLHAKAGSLNNAEGLLSSRGVLNLDVDSNLINRDGALIADGNVVLNAASVDNGSGQIASKQDLTARIGNLQQQGGYLTALGSLDLTGASLYNRLKGLVSANGPLTLNVGNVDNRSGEVSSQAGIAFVGQHLDNSDSGRIVSQKALTLTVDHSVNRNGGMLSGNTGLILTGATLDNGGGSLLSQQSADLDLRSDLLNDLGGLSSEGALNVSAASLSNNGGSLSSAGPLRVQSAGAVSNQSGKLVTDGSLDVTSASLDNSFNGNISSKGPGSIHTGDFDNSHNGSVSSADTLVLSAAQLTNAGGGSIGSNRALIASVSGLDQQGGTLFSNTSLTLDLNHGQLNNQGGLINAPGALLLKNLAGVDNRNGEISSLQGFEFNAENFDNNSGKLLGDQALVVRVTRALTNVKGMIAAASLDTRAGSLDNGGGSLASRADLTLDVTGLLTNKNEGLINAANRLKVSSVNLDNRGGLMLGGSALVLRAGEIDNRASGLINSQGTLELSAVSLNSSDAGELSAKGTMALSLDSLLQNGGRLLGYDAVALNLNGGDLSNQQGLIRAKGLLTLGPLRDVNNQSGEISSSQSFTLGARMLDNGSGKLISSQVLTLNADSLLNQGGLLSGWEGLSVSGGSLDNRNSGTLSSRNGDVGASFTGALLNGTNGALVSQNALSVTAASLDNRGGILSSGAGQAYNISGLLDNSQSGLIDSGTTLTINIARLGNASGTITAQQALSFTGTDLDNSAGNITGNASITLDLLGSLTNINGKLASAGDLLIARGVQIDNGGGQLVSQRALTLTTGSLDNRNRGTVAANDSLRINANGLIQNSDDGLIYSKNAGLTLQAASLKNGQGTLQSQAAMDVLVTGNIDNQSGKIIAQDGSLNATANTFDNRGGVLSSLRNALTARIDGIMRNGNDVNRTGGVVQAQNLDMRALAGIDNYGGRISARSGDTLINTGNGNFDNRNGGLYAKQRISVTGNDFDNSGDNDGQIAGQRIDLNLTGALNNRLGIIESDSMLTITAASLDNQSGRLRALGTSGVTRFQIGGLLDNRNGTLETANTDLALGVGGLLNGGGNILHVGGGTFGVATNDVMNAGGSLITRGVLNLNADSWTNSSVLQAGTLNVNVNNFTQTSAGQLLASDAFVGTGGNWTNDGLIASDGTLSLSLGGQYSGNGRLSSLGNLGLSAGQLSLGSVGSIAGGGRTDINVAGALTHYGRVTSSTDLFVTAGSVGNYGTFGAAQSLTLSTPSMTNAQGLIFSGADMQLNTASLSNLKGDFYSLRDLTIGGYGIARAHQVSNVSGSMESGGRFAMNATTFENRTEGSDGAQGFAVGRTLVKGLIAVQCLDCTGDHYSLNYVARETYNAGEDNDTSASALLTAGSDFTFTGGRFLNSKSTVSASGNISIQADNFKNIGAVSGTIERTRTYFQGGATDGTVKRFMPLIVEYNQRNNPDFPKNYYVAPDGELRLGVVSYSTAREPGHDGGLIKVTSVNDDVTKANVTNLTLSGYAYGSQPVSQYDPANLVQLPAALGDLTLVSTMEVAKDGSGNAGRSAVIQAGGNVSIAAIQDLQNSVIHQDYASAGGASKVADTRANGTGKTVVVRLSAQLPPDLAQQQIDPTALPGFSLPTGQNGLFRLSAQGGSAVTSTDKSPAPQNWSITGASIVATQRDQAAPVTQVSDIRIAALGPITTETRQLTVTGRERSAIDSNAKSLNTAAPVDAGNGGLFVPLYRGDVTSVVSVDKVVGVTAGQPLAATLPSEQTTAIQNIGKVQGLPVSIATPNAHKYLIETNPVLTDLKQFMSSDYLLGALGYDPDASTKRLGDGFYEQRLVQQAVIARTGQAFIDGQTSNQDQFKYLMNNAIASKDALNLAVGVSLTPQQVAALTHDIVWLEEREVNGEKVLVPVLYLAQADNRLAPNGALIAGRDVSLIAGQNLDNVGTLKSTHNLSATAGQDLVNSGLIQAGNRLDLLAGNDIVNKAGGIIAGRDMTMTAIGGNVINERTITSLDSDARGQRHQDYVDNAARIEAVNNLSISAGRDINNIGSVLQAGRDLTLNAGRDVNIASTQAIDSLILDSKHTRGDITQIGSTVSAGRNLSVQAGRDINAIASQIDARRDIALAATQNINISSAADEDHYLSKSKKLTVKEDHVSQVSTDIMAGSSVAINAGKNLAVISSRITAGDEAYLVAGDRLDILAAQDSDYSLYDKKSKGSFGAKKNKRDEETQITHIGSEITTGGDLLLVSGGNQRYEIAKLDSGNDLLIDSGGAITFEGVKDLHQESHQKSNFSLSWNSMSGKGNTDETLRQSELLAKGNLAINAVDGLHIDVKQVNQQSVSQAIDAMVKADPNLGWLKEAEKRGDVDWRQVKEFHDSYKYSNSGLGQGAMLAIAIVVTYLTWGAGSSLAGVAANSAGGVAADSVAASVISNAATSTINNRGNLGAVAKDVTSSDSLKRYAIAGVSGGVGNYSIGLQLAVNSALKSVLQGGKFKDNLTEAAVMMAANVVSGYLYENAGNALNGSGLATKAAVHAIVGGLIGEAAGG